LIPADRFVGSDDFLRGKFEEYLCSVLAAIKLVDFVAKGRENQVLITGSGIVSPRLIWLLPHLRS
jgi:hypothetical protein